MRSSFESLLMTSKVFSAAVVRSRTVVRTGLLVQFCAVRSRCQPKLNHSTVLGCGIDRTVLCWFGRVPNFEPFTTLISTPTSRQHPSSASYLTSMFPDLIIVRGQRFRVACSSFGKLHAACRAACTHVRILHVTTPTPYPQLATIDSCSLRRSVNTRRHQPNDRCLRRPWLGI
ncbi:hypothetical protein EDB19DRAFT_1147037 [Suillus lakei]|nr:hypothetical protein EDB19DRAFT_1147037 [Suillus lakei]